jgi:excisionase family DNA binding protein
MQVENTQLYRVRAVAALADVSVATVYRAIESGKLAALKFGHGKGALRVSGAAVNAWLAGCATAAKQADGLACVVCGVDFRTTPEPQVPVGVSDTGSQVFACKRHRDKAAEADRRLFAIVTGRGV